MKIQIIHDRLARGGQERQIIELLKSFKKRPHISVQLIFFSDEVAYPEINSFGYDVHFLKRRFKLDPLVWLNYYKLCKAFRPDIIHNWGQLAPVYAVVPSKILGITFINQNIMNATKGLNLLNKNYFKAKLTFPFSDIVIGNSNAGLKAYGAPGHKSRCIYNGFDFDRRNDLTNPRDVRDQLSIKSGPVVGMVAAFHNRKDYETFIKGAIILLNKGVEANFLAIGHGPSYKKCKEMIPEKYSERIVLPGQLSNVESVINVFDIGVLCTNSKAHGEGISNAIIEYMVFAKPVIATDGGGTPEIVKNNINGFLVPDKSPHVLAERIDYILTQPGLGLRLGKEGQKSVYENFSIQKMEQQYLELYEELLFSDRKKD